MGQRKAGVLLDGAAVHLLRDAKIAGQLVGAFLVFATAKIELVRLGAPRRPAFDATFFLGRKPCLEGAGYLLGDRALDGEYVGQLAIVAISPDLPIVVGVAQPRLDAYAIACPLYGALEYGGHTAPRRCHAGCASPSGTAAPRSAR